MKRAWAAARRSAALALLAAVPLAGCSSVGGGVGAVAGTTAAVGSGNPAVGTAVGVGTRAAADYGIRYVSRRQHRTEQGALAAVVGAMAVGEARPWEVRHDLPFGDKRVAKCREVLSSVASGEEADAARRWFVTSVCRQAEGGWKWAAVEPATERWGSLQQRLARIRGLPAASAVAPADRPPTVRLVSRGRARLASGFGWARSTT